MKIITILGTRPEIIKLASLIPKLNETFNHILIHTGQHYDYEMDQTFFNDLNLQPPKYNLCVGSERQGKQTALMIEKIEEILLQENPDLIIVLGDTNTTLSGALAAKKLHLPIAHVEAGCRSFNKQMPEETNRIVADHCSTLLFAADQESIDNLSREGLMGKNIFLVGNTIFDAVIRNKELAKKSSILDQNGLERGKYVLVTIHRQQSTDNKEVLENITLALKKLSNKINVIFTIHPRTKKALETHKIHLDKRIKVIEPQGYLPFLHLLENCRFCITDSGGIQDEALVFNVPALIPRYETEWVRLVKAGKNFLVGNKEESILKKSEELLDESELERVKNIRFPYETGVAEKIVEIIRQNLESLTK